MHYMQKTIEETKIYKLLCFIKREAISVDGRFIEIDTAPYFDELHEIMENSK